MIIKSEAYKRAIKDYSRSFSSIFNIDGVDKDLHVKSLRINEIGIANDMLTIGGIYTNQLEMKILYPEKNAVTDTSIINIQGGIKVNGALDTTSLGWFYAYEVETNTNGNEMTVKAYDKSTLLKKTYIPNVSAPALLEDVVKDILGQCSIDLEETTVFPNYVVDTFVEGSTCLEMLGYCAGLMGRNGRMNRNNKFEFYWYHKPAVLDITRSGMQYMNGVSKGISLNYSALVSGTKDNVISSGSGKAIEFTNPLMTQEILDEVCAELLGSAGLTYTILDCEWRGDFAVQCGDTVRVEDKDGAMLTALVTEQEIYFCGGLKSKISSKGKSDTQTAMKSPTQTRLEKMESSLIESFKKIGETILGHRGGYYTVDVDENGNPCGWTIMNTPTLRDDTHLWRMTMGGLGYSEDGGRTFNDLAFDLNGNFSANVINTGVLKGNNFEINLNDGSILMGPRDSRGEISDPVLSVSPSGELTLKAISDVEKEIQDVKLVPDVTIDTLYPTYQTYDKSAGIYIPDYSKQDQVLTPEVRVLGILKPLDPAKITWSKKNGELGQGETIVDGALHISRNLGEEEGNVAYVLDYEYASGQHKKVEVSIGLTVVGSDGTGGKDAATCLIVPSGTSFTSSDGITYTPDKITLTPQFQGCGFDMWQYSSDGITWNNIVSGQYGFTIKADKTLTISNTTPLLTDTNKCLNIKLLSNQLNVVSVVTITKIKDGQKGDKGDTGVSITKVEVEYYLSTSNTTQTGGSWSTSIPAWANGKYIWSRTKTTLSNGTATTTNPACITGGKGATGATGQGIASITTEFYLSTSKTTQTNGSWVTTMPAWENGKYVWTRSKIVYKNPTSTAYTTPVCDTGWEAVNDIEIGGRNLATGTSLMKMGGGGRAKGHWRKSGLNTEVEIIDAVDAPVEGVGKILKITQTELRANCGIAQDGTPILNGQTYTMSVWVRGSADGISIALQPWGKASENSSGMHYFTTSTEWKLVEVTVENKITETGTYSASYVYISARNTVPNATIEVCGVKLEKGNKATDWTPAPEDIENDYNSKISATTKSLADLKVETDNIRLGVETIKETLIETNTGLSTLTETYNSYMQQTDQRFSLILQQSKEYTDGITQNVNEIAKYFNVTTDGLEISAYDSADAEVGRVKSLMSNDRFAIKFDDTEVMQIYKDEMRIDNIKLRKSLTLNPWIVSGYGSGETGGWVFKWGGF